MSGLPARRPPRVRTTLLIAFAALLAPIPMAPAIPGGQAPCLGSVAAEDVPGGGGGPFRFGISPGGGTGHLGPPAKPVPDKPAKTLEALARLRSSRKTPFVVRLDRLSWSQGVKGVERAVDATKRYTSRGYLVELQLRYSPNARQEGNVEAFSGWVRRVVRRVGSDPRVVGVQVANEVNLTTAPHSADGAYARARDALIHGVVAAKQEARVLGYRHVEVGFNWFYRTDQRNEERFWSYLRERGGAAFAGAVDWVGVDAFPGTYFPPATSPGAERDALVNALSVLRECFLPTAGIPDSVPIRIEENGFPTGGARTYQLQAQMLESMVRTVHRYRGTFNVTDYRWFQLRDGNTRSPSLLQHHGVLESDYTPKPAFRVYRELVRTLSASAARNRA